MEESSKFGLRCGSHSKLHDCQACVEHPVQFDWLSVFAHLHKDMSARLATCIQLQNVSCTWMYIHYLVNKTSPLLLYCSQSNQQLDAPPQGYFCCCSFNSNQTECHEYSHVGSSHMIQNAAASLLHILDNLLLELWCGIWGEWGMCSGANLLRLR